VCVWVERHGNCSGPSTDTGFTPFPSICTFSPFLFIHQVADRDSTIANLQSVLLEATGRTRASNRTARGLRAGASGARGGGVPASDDSDGGGAGGCMCMGGYCCKLTQTIAVLL
jgi:hypothetical protein